MNPVEFVIGTVIKNWTFFEFIHLHCQQQLQQKDYNAISSWLIYLFFFTFIIDVDRCSYFCKWLVFMYTFTFSNSIKNGSFFFCVLKFEWFNNSLFNTNDQIGHIFVVWFAIPKKRKSKRKNESQQKNQQWGIFHFLTLQLVNVWR